MGSVPSLMVSQPSGCPSALQSMSIAGLHHRGAGRLWFSVPADEFGVVSTTNPEHPFVSEVPYRGLAHGDRHQAALAGGTEAQRARSDRGCQVLCLCPRRPPSHSNCQLALPYHHLTMFFKINSLVKLFLIYSRCRQEASY